MEYKIATKEELNEIIIMKNLVKKRIIKENLQIWLNGYPLDEMIVEDIEKGYGRIVVHNNEVIAYAVFHPTDDEYPKNTFSIEPLMSFGRVMVKDGHTGKHVGDFLVSKMIEEARKMNALGMGILADSFNTKAVNLYKKHGFKYEKTDDFVYARLAVYTLIF